MFRCITELKGLVVDIDSFGSGDKAIWIDINSIIPCVFISADKNTREYLSILFGAEKVIAMKKFEKIFAPNKVTHARVLTVLKVQNTEVAYLSASHEFLKKANSFLCGSIWVTDTDRITYEQASESPDLIIESLTELKIALQRHVAGFYGEMLLFPGANFPARMLPVDFNADDDNDSDIVPMYVLGRYYGYAHYMNQLHPYSSAIYLNKKTRRTYTGVFDKRFESIYSAAVNAIKPAHKIDCICAVPVKPGKTPRFDNILNGVASTCGIENIGKQFICIHNYSDQKSLSKEERNKNVRGAFSFAGDLTGRTVVLIDDISSTGSTLRECIRVLRNSGAQEVVVIVLAINQNKLGAYWSLDNPQVTCPDCGGKMVLLANKNGGLFYSCIDCYKQHKPNSSCNFIDGWKQLCDSENEKFDKIIVEQERMKQAINEGNETEPISLERTIKCPYCGSINKVDFGEFADKSTYDRQMGTETLYEFDTDSITCTSCQNLFHIDGHICEYPPGAFDSEDVNVAQLEEDL